MTQTPTISQPATTQGQPVYEISDDDKSRQQAISDAWTAYNGLLDKPLSVMSGEPDDNVMSNRCQSIVNQGINFLFGKELEISVDEGAPQEAQDFLDKTWGRKETRVPLLQKLAMSGAIAGQAFLRIVPGDSGNYRLIGVDPSTVFVQTAPQDCETVMLYCIEYSTKERVNGHNVEVFYREEITRIDPDGNALQGLPDTDDTWSVQHWSRVGSHGPWTPAGEPIIWPYEFAPLFSCQNLPKPNDFWGFSDLPPDLVGMNKALNLVASDINRNGKLFAQPIIYATGTGQQVIDIKPGKIIGLPTTESKVVAVHVAADIPSMLAFAADLRSDIDEQSGVPGVATGRITAMPRGQLSGIAIELLFQPLLQKTGTKQCSYGALIIEVSKALLVLNGYSQDIDITLAFQSPLPHDDLQSVQAALAKKELDISNTTLQRELGYDPDEEQELSQSEDALKLQAAQQNAQAAGLPPGVPGSPNLPGQMYPPPAPTPGQPAQSPFIGGQ